MPIQYPYGLPELKHDNPNMDYDNNVDVLDAFYKSQQHIKYGFILQELFVPERPTVAPNGYAYLYSYDVAFDGSKFYATWIMIKTSDYYPEKKQ
jgi:hypothetical protein